MYAVSTDTLTERYFSEQRSAFEEKVLTVSARIASNENVRTQLAELEQSYMRLLQKTRARTHSPAVIRMEQWLTDMDKRLTRLVKQRQRSHFALECGALRELLGRVEVSVILGAHPSNDGGHMDLYFTSIAREVQKLQESCPRFADLEAWVRELQGRLERSQALYALAPSERPALADSVERSAADPLKLLADH